MCVSITSEQRKVECHDGEGLHSNVLYVHGKKNVHNKIKVHIVKYWLVSLERSD